MLNDLHSWLDTVAQVIIAFGVGFGIYQRIVADRSATARATLLADKIGEIKEQTNGMSHRLEALAGEAGEGRGRAAAAAEAKGP